MTAFRVFSLAAHSAVELMIGLALMVAPFVITLGPAATVIAVVLGALIAGFGVGAADGLPVSTHFAFDQVVTAVLLVAAIALGLDGDAAGAVLFCAVAISLLTLTMTTRYSRAARL